MGSAHYTWPSSVVWLSLSYSTGARDDLPPMILWRWLVECVGPYAPSEGTLRECRPPIRQALDIPMFPVPAAP